MTSESHGTPSDERLQEILSLSNYHSGEYLSMARELLALRALSLTGSGRGVDEAETCISVSGKPSGHIWVQTDGVPNGICSKCGTHKDWLAAHSLPDEAIGDWVLVPREPTAAMLIAACEAQENSPCMDTIGPMEHAYTALLFAAPTLKQTGSVVDDDLAAKAKFMADMAGVDSDPYFDEKARSISWQELASTAMGALKATRRQVEASEPITAREVTEASCPGCSGTGWQGGNELFGACDDCSGSGRVAVEMKS